MDENVIVKSMNVGTLFHLRYKQPVIDGVGYLQENNDKIVSLVMIQVSLSPYEKHITRENHLVTRLSCVCARDHRIHCRFAYGLKLPDFCKYCLGINQSIV